MMSFEKDWTRTDIRAVEENKMEMVVPYTVKRWNMYTETVCTGSQMDIARQEI